jgi:hypothetical protein
MSPADKSKKLWEHYSVDFVAGLCTAFAISPFIATIDKAVCDAAVNRFTMMESVKMGVTEMFTRPWRYFTRKEFLFCWGIYTATYATANLTETYVSEVLEQDPTLPKFAATAIVNIPCRYLKKIQPPRLPTHSIFVV